MSPTVITLIFLAFAIIMFVTEKIPLGLTSMIVCVGLVITDVLSVSDAFNGFINSNVILFVAMFIVGGALFETGMANEIGSLVTKFAKTERSLIIAIMVIVAVMSGFLSNTGTAADCCHQAAREVHQQRCADCGDNARATKTVYDRFRIKSFRVYKRS